MSDTTGKANRIPKIDTYEILEFQGIVADTPTYERKIQKLSFVARALNRPTLKFVAHGDIAKAFRVLLHKDSVIQLQAVPKHRLEVIGDGRYRIIEWEVKRMCIVGRQRINLGKYADSRILDGLMPEEGDYEDIGYVNEWWLKNFLKKIGGGDDDG